MAGVSMRGGAELRKLQEALKRTRSPEFKRKLLKQLSHEGLNQVAVCFDTETDPYNHAWVGWRNPPAYRRGGKILSDTGRLRNSFRASANPQTFVISSNVVYAAIHLYGGELNGAVMPARRYLPFPGRLGPRWTPAFTAIAKTMMARELGQAGAH